jgi:hypothetical protein
MYRVISAALGISLVALPEHAESLMQQVSGAWTLTSGAEQMPDGSKKIPWSAGNLILTPTGHFAIFVFGPDRQAEGPPDPRKPAGPMVAYYGTFTADDAAKTLTYHVENASAPAFNGITRDQSVTVTSDILITKGSRVAVPVQHDCANHGQRPTFAEGQRGGF